MSTAAVSTVMRRGEPSKAGAGAGLIKIKDVAAYLGISLKSVWNLVDNNALRATDVSGGRNPTGRRTLRIAPEEVQRFLRANATQPLNDT